MGRSQRSFLAALAGAAAIALLWGGGPSLAASGQGRSVVSLLESRASDREVAVRLGQLQGGGGDWLAALFEVFKESRRDIQENQNYYLKRLEERNKINDAISEYQRELTEQAGKLNEKVRNADDEDKKRERELAIMRVESSLKNLEAQTQAATELSEPLRREILAQTAREGALLARARSVVRHSAAEARNEEQRRPRAAPPPVDPPPDNAAPSAVRRIRPPPR